MPWDANSFATKHNHKLHGKAARGASEAANKALASGKDDASAIRIGNYVGDKVMSKSYAKGGDMQACSYAEGGAVLGRVRDFIKDEPDQFRGNKRSSTPGTTVGPTVTHDIPQEYVKGGKKGSHKDKSLNTVMPRK